jgi:hypothetical protein
MLPIGDSRLPHPVDMPEDHRRPDLAGGRGARVPSGLQRGGKRRNRDRFIGLQTERHQRRCHVDLRDRHPHRGGLGQRGRCRRDRSAVDVIAAPMSAGDAMVGIGGAELGAVVSGWPQAAVPTPVNPTRAPAARRCIHTRFGGLTAAAVCRPIANIPDFIITPSAVLDRGCRRHPAGTGTGTSASPRHWMDGRGRPPRSTAGDRPRYSGLHRLVSAAATP